MFTSTQLNAHTWHEEHTDLREQTHAVHSSWPTHTAHIFRPLHHTVDTSWFIARTMINNIPTHSFPQATGTEVTSEETAQSLKIEDSNDDILSDYWGSCSRPLLIKHGRAPSVCEQFGRFRAGSVNHSHYQIIWDATSRQRPLGWTLIIWRGQSGLNQLETPVAWAWTKTPVAIHLWNEIDRKLE